MFPEFFKILSIDFFMFITYISSGDEKQTKMLILSFI